MNTGDLENAKRRALNILDEWLDVTDQNTNGTTRRIQ
jgi:hypothetical protein